VTGRVLDSVRHACDGRSGGSARADGSSGGGHGQGMPDRRVPREPRRRPVCTPTLGAHSSCSRQGDSRAGLPASVSTHGRRNRIRRSWYRDRAAPSWPVSSAASSARDGRERWAGWRWTSSPGPMRRRWRSSAAAGKRGRGSGRCRPCDHRRRCPWGHFLPRPVPWLDRVCAKPRRAGSLRGGAPRGKLPTSIWSGRREPARQPGKRTSKVPLASARMWPPTGNQRPIEAGG
jgi:hypothetical protein